MTLGSLFSGIGGFDLAAGRVGMDVRWQVEIDPFARRVLEKHWPGVKQYDDVRAVDPGELERVDVLAFGSPCQDWSVAGQRAGIGGERSGLFFEAIRIARALRPAWLVFENVPGLFSSWSPVEAPPEPVVSRPDWDVDETSDFATVLAAFQELGYLGAWRVLDAQHFGVAQRRRRVFIVGCLGADRLAALLPFLASGSRHPAPRRATGEKPAGTLGSGTPGSSWSDDPDRMTFIPSAGVAPTLRRSNPSGDHNGDEGLLVTALPPLAGDGARKWGKGTGGPAGDECQNLVASPLVAFSANDDGRDSSVGVSPTLRCGGIGGGGVHTAVAFTERTRADGRNLEVIEEQAYCLTNPGSGGRTHSRQNLAGMAVRRLSPTECERLQGFSWREGGEWRDGWTCLCGRNLGRSMPAEDACRCPDGPRYRALGNAVAVPVVEWILRRVLEAERCDGA